MKKLIFTLMFFLIISLPIIVYFATAFYKIPGSVMITASHNPKEYNGLKISGRNAVPVGYDTGLADLEKMIESPVRTAAVKGTIGRLDIRKDYMAADDDNEWYKTQVGSGIGNCGPACVSMAIKWSTEHDVTVERVRKYISYTRLDGATDFRELASAMMNWDAPYDIIEITSLTGLKDLVDGENLIAIVLINTDKIKNADEITDNLNGMFGKNYKYDGGHYIVLSEVDSSFFVVQDPVPPGANRRYHIDEVWLAMKKRQIILIRNYFD